MGFLKSDILDMAVALIHAEGQGSENWPYSFEVTVL